TGSHIVVIPLQMVVVHLESRDSSKNVILSNLAYLERITFFWYLRVLKSLKLMGMASPYQKKKIVRYDTI
ncbi:hypothetical protein P9618_26950, partial [Bacillus pseudomycoides]|nr:hypothetical protein [Bacillus pseudomycoides]